MLASMAAALYPFTGIPEIEYFQNYCDALGMSYSVPGDCLLLFDPRVIDARIGTGQQSGKSGYQWLRALFHGCPGSAFDSARGKAKIEDEPDLGVLERQLITERCTSVVAINPLGHSISVYHDSSVGYFLRDSALPNTHPLAQYDVFGPSVTEAIQKYLGQSVSVGDKMIVSAI